MALFTAENAAEMQLASARAKLAKKAEKLATDALSPLPANVRWELDIVEEQISHARKVLNDKTPNCLHCERPALQPQHMAQLLKALDSLLDRRRDLQGRPRIGTQKPTTRPIKRGSPAPEPE